MSDDQPDEVRAQLLDARAWECYLSHDLVESRAAAEEARRLWERLGEWRRWAYNLERQVSSYMAVAEWLPEAQGALDDVITVLEELPPGPELVFACSTQAALAAMRFGNTDAVQWARRADALAEQIGAEAVRGDARFWVGVALAQSGDAEGWSVMEDRRRAVLAAPPDPFFSWALWWPYHVAVSQRRYDLTETFFSEGVAYVVETRQRDHSSVLSVVASAPAARPGPVGRSPRARRTGARRQPAR